jgi:hypothetical protein
MADNSVLEWSKFAVPLIVAAATITVGFIQYGTTSSFTVRQPFLQKQTDLCISAADNAARLATSIDTDVWAKARADFLALYWGPLAVVEDVEASSRPVETAMVEFLRELERFPVNPTTLPLDALEQPSLKVAHACQSILSERWQAGILGWFAHSRS